MEYGPLCLHLLCCIYLFWGEGECAVHGKGRGRILTIILPVFANCAPLVILTPIHDAFLSLSLTKKAELHCHVLLLVKPNLMNVFFICFSNSYIYLLGIAHLTHCGFKTPLLVFAIDLDYSPIIM